LSLLTGFGRTTMWVYFKAVDGPVFPLREMGKSGFFRLNHLEASVTRPPFAIFVCVKKLTRAPLMASRDCVNTPDSFCYICGEVVVKKQHRNISDFVKTWAPHKVCSVCVEDLRLWSKCKKNSFRFGVPMIWRQPPNHGGDCNFCTCNIQGYSLKNKKDIVYPNLPSAIIMDQIFPYLNPP
jgi:hypothetical protein